MLLKKSTNFSAINAHMGSPNSFLELFLGLVHELHEKISFVILKKISQICPKLLHSTIATVLVHLWVASHLHLVTPYRYYHHHLFFFSQIRNRLITCLGPHSYQVGNHKLSTGFLNLCVIFGIGNGLKSRSKEI